MHIYKLIGLIIQVQAKVIMIKAIWPFIIQLLTIYETKMALVHTSYLWTNRLHVQVHNTIWHPDDIQCSYHTYNGLTFVRLLNKL